MYLEHQDLTEDTPPHVGLNSWGGVCHEDTKVSLTLFMSLEGLRYIAGEFLPSDEVTPPWPVRLERAGARAGAGSGHNLPSTLHLHRTSVLCCVGQSWEQQ